MFMRVVCSCNIRIHLTISFFLNDYADLGHLHSFPTRRSSDLRDGDCAPCRGCNRVSLGELHARVAPGSATVRRGLLQSQERSEEHTSELQSHSDLVCRLLLEKKKKYNLRRRMAITRKTTRQSC